MTDFVFEVAFAIDVAEPIPAPVFTSGAGPFYDPLASGTVVGAVSGTLTPLLVDPPFAVGSGRNIIVGAAPLTDGTIAVVGTAGGVAYVGSVVVIDAIPLPPVFVAGLGPFYAPLAPGAVVGTISGTATPIVVAAPFTAGTGRNVVVGASPLGSGSYSVSGTAGGTAFTSGAVVVNVTIPLTDMAVVITYAGVATTYSQVGATDMGDYVDPDGVFIQHNLKPARQDTQMRAYQPFFRPDASGTRQEIVFELGDPWEPLAIASVTKGNPTIVTTVLSHGLQTGMFPTIIDVTGNSKVNIYQGTVPLTKLSATSFSLPIDTSAEGASTGGFVPGWNYGPHTVQIYDDGALVATVNLPAHYHYARWRWQSAPRPVRKTAAALIAAGVVPHYGLVPTGRGRANMAAATFSPMTFSNLNVAMGSGGGDEKAIGPLMGAQANWLVTGANISTVIAHAEASATCSYHMRDSVTGAPIDAIVYHHATEYSRSVGSPYIKAIRGLVLYDSGHCPAMCYLPALLTGDPYYIEELQFQANEEIIGKPPGYRYTDAGRYCAWPLRNKLYADVMAPISPPSWLLPKGNFHAHMELVRGKADIDRLNTTDVIRSVFHIRQYGGAQTSAAHPIGTYSAPWQDAFETLIYNLCIQLGYTEWAAMAHWKIVNDMKRLGEGGEFPRASPVPYFLQHQYTCNLAAACNATDTVLSLDAYALPPWPALPFQVDVESEHVLVTAMAGQTWTVTRGYAGSTAVAHAVGGVDPTRVVGQKYLTWTECGNRAIARYASEIPFMPGDPTGMNQLYHGTSASMDYIQYQRAALAVAVRNGMTEATSHFAWMDAQFALYVSGSWEPTWPWMIT